MKKSSALAILMIVLTMLTVCFCLSSAIAEESGWLGKIFWALDSSETLSISGNDRIPALGNLESGWLAYKLEIQSVEIEDGVTGIGFGAFTDCENLTSVTIPASVTNIDSSAFRGCNKIENVYYMGSEEQWANIIGNNNAALSKATIHYNFVPDTANEMN